MLRSEFHRTRTRIHMHAHANRPNVNVYVRAWLFRRVRINRRPANATPTQRLAERAFCVDKPLGVNRFLPAHVYVHLHASTRLGRTTKTTGFCCVRCAGCILR